MAAKPKSFEKILGAKIASVLPPEFKELVLRVSLNPECLYTVVVFQGMSSNGSHIIDSKSLVKAISKVGAGKSIVVFGRGFTQEALAVLAERGVLGAGQSDFFWTDESWRRVSAPQER